MRKLQSDAEVSNGQREGDAGLRDGAFAVTRLWRDGPKRLRNAGSREPQRQKTCKNSFDKKKNTTQPAHVCHQPRPACAHVVASKPDTCLSAVGRGYVRNYSVPVCPPCPRALLPSCPPSLGLPFSRPSPPPHLSPAQSPPFHLDSSHLTRLSVPPFRFVVSCYDARISPVSYVVSRALVLTRRSSVAGRLSPVPRSQPLDHWSDARRYFLPFSLSIYFCCTHALIRLTPPASKPTLGVTDLIVQFSSLGTIGNQRSSLMLPSMTDTSACLFA